MPPRAAPRGQARQGGAQERRADPTDPGSRRQYTRQQFDQFYGPAKGASMWRQAANLGGGAPPPLRAVRSPQGRRAPPRGGPLRSPPRARGGELRVGQRVRTTGRLVGDAGQVVPRGMEGKVTAVPGRGVRLERGAVAEVHIGGVTFDASPDMIELVGARQPRAPAPRAPKPRLTAARAPRTRQTQPRAYASPPRARAQGGAQKRPDPTMKPGQKGAGKLYTKAQFTQFYGPQFGPKMWKKAGQLRSGQPQQQKSGPQKRPDPTMKPGQKGANKLYTKEQFNQFYGPQAGAKLWKKAGQLATGGGGKALKKAAGPEKRPDPTMKKGQKGAGKLYTRAQFDQFYGPQIAAKLWKKAASLAPKKQGKAAAPAAGDRRPDPTMKKGQKGASKLYTRAQFDQFYGPQVGKKLWVQAGKLVKKGGGAGGAEKRPDPTMKAGQKGANKLYTREQFDQFYGKEAGAKLWKAAGKKLAKGGKSAGKKGAKAPKGGKKDAKKQKKEKAKPVYVQETVQITRAEGQAVGWERHTKSQVIIKVEQGSPAAAAGLAKGMKIHSVAGKEVKTDDDVKAAMGAAGASFDVVVSKRAPKKAASPKASPKAAAGSPKGEQSPKAA